MKLEQTCKNQTKGILIVGYKFNLIRQGLLTSTGSAHRLSEMGCRKPLFFLLIENSESQ
jgi:hypothetical protein